MKCIFNHITNEIKRVSEERADELVAKGWTFCSKKRWKMEVRDIVKVAAVEAVIEQALEAPVTVPEKKKVQGRQRMKKLGEN